MIYLKQSTAVTIKAGPFLDDTDGKTAETGLSIAQADVRLSKNGADIIQKNSTTATSHNELGYYNIHLSATDTNTLGALKVMISMAGALPVWADFMVVHAKAYDAMFSTGTVELTSAYDNAKIAPDNSGILAIKAKTDNLPSSPAATGDIPSDSDIATAVWGAVTRTLSESPTDVSELTTKADIETAKDAIISAMPELDTSQLEGKVDAVKAKTDQLQFTSGKVNANATIDLGASDIAKQSTSEQILAMFAEPPIEIIGSVKDGKITAIRGNDWELVIPCELPDDAKIQMAVKSNAGMRDDQSAIFLDSTTGLIYLDKDNGNAADGSLVYAAGNLTLTLAAAATAKLSAGNYRYGIQSVSQAGKVTEKYQGDFLISNDIVKATS